MKIAIIGQGKTGSHLLDLIPAENIVGPFTSSNPISVEALSEAHVAIAFVPGPAVETLIDVLVEAKIPTVWGATGVTWPSDIEKVLTEKSIRWIHGTNFSLGMALVHNMIKVMKAANALVKNPEYKIHEVHHTKKLDAPSGTAISWSKWLGQDCPITHEREGDVKGIHQMSLRTQTEEITLRHESLDRKLFAEGALWAAGQITQADFPAGLTLFETLTTKVLKDVLHDNTPI